MKARLSRRGKGAATNPASSNNVGRELVLELGKLVPQKELAFFQPLQLELVRLARPKNPGTETLSINPRIDAMSTSSPREYGPHKRTSLSSI